MIQQIKINLFLITITNDNNKAKTDYLCSKLKEIHKRNTRCSQKSLQMQLQYVSKNIQQNNIFILFKLSFQNTSQMIQRGGQYYMLFTSFDQNININFSTWSLYGQFATNNYIIWQLLYQYYLAYNEMYLQSTENQDHISYPKVGDLEVKKDWLFTRPPDEYKQNVLICTRLAAVRVIEQKNMVEKSNLFKLAHLKAEGTTILQETAKQNLEESFKTRNTKSWNFIAQKQGGNLFKKIYQRKCNFNFDQILIESQSKKQNITLNPYQCKYKIEDSKSKDIDTMFPWLPNFTSRIIITAPNNRKFAIYVAKPSDARYIIDQINLKKACQSLSKYSHIIEKSSDLFKKKVVVASAEKLNQNGKFIEFQKEEQEKEAALKKEQMLQSLQAQQIPIQNTRPGKSSKIMNMSPKKTVNSSPYPTPNSPYTPEIQSPTRRNKNKLINPTHIKNKQSQIEFGETKQNFDDIPLSKIMLLRSRSTIDPSYQPQENPEFRSQVKVPEPLREVEQNSEENRNRDPSFKINVEEIHSGGETGRRRKRSFYVFDAENQMQLKQVEVQDDHWKKSQGKRSEKSFNSEVSIPNLKLDVYVTIIGLELFVRHFQKFINLQFVQLVDAQTQTAKSKSIQFRKAVIHLKESTENPLIFTCKHQCFTFSSFSENYRIIIQLPNKVYSSQLKINMFDVHFESYGGSVLFFKEAPFAGFLMYMVTKRPIAPVEKLSTVQYLQHYITDYNKRYRMMDINQLRAKLRMEFHQKTWNYLDKRKEVDFFEKLVHTGVPDTHKKYFYSCIPQIDMQETTLSYYQCDVLMNSLESTFKDHILYTLDSKYDLITQLSSLQVNRLFKDRLKVLMSFYKFKLGSTQPFLFALCYSILSKLKPIIIGLQKKRDLQKLIQLYLEVQYQFDELFSQVYSYMNK